MRKDCGATVVCPDAIRLAIHGRPFVGTAEPFVWATAQAMVRALFHAGHDMVILDATNTTRDRRRMWANGAGLYDTRFRVFWADREQCASRANSDGRPDLLPVIERMAAQFEPLGDGEAELDDWYT
jgi:predicted kinase